MEREKAKRIEEFEWQKLSTLDFWQLYIIILSEILVLILILLFTI